MDQLPLPSLQLYSVFSGFSLLYAVIYGLNTPDGFFSALWNDAWFTAGILNFGLCIFFHFVNAVHELVFGNLQNSEKKHLQDTFWNFVFYKFIFVFGVMNVQDLKEIMLWMSWFAFLGALVLTSQLCKDRFQYLSFSPSTTTSSHAKIIILLSLLLIVCAGLFMVCAIVGWQFGFNYFAFLFAEVYIIFAKTLHILIKYIIHLWDMHHDGLWENRNTYTYFTELVLEISSLSIDFCHHLHMLIWANMMLSVASLILLLKLRYLYHEIHRKLRRHSNYSLVNTMMDQCFQLMHGKDLANEVCAVCWEKMSSARRLPCGHIFHFGCLRSWLEQDPVCPTCRFSLKDLLKGKQLSDQGNSTRRRRRNWLLYFNGASIASWLPTFSLELHHQTNREGFDRNVEEIHSMFPNVSVRTISNDLAATNSVSQTVENILNGAIDDPLVDDDPHIPSPHQIHIDEVPQVTTDSSTTVQHESSTELPVRSCQKPTTLRQRKVGKKYDREYDEKITAISVEDSFEEKKQKMIAAARKRYLQRTACNDYQEHDS